MSDVEIGRHAEAIDTLKEEVQFLREDVGEIKDILAAIRVGARSMVTIGMVAASMGGTIAGVAVWLANHST